VLNLVLYKPIRNILIQRKEKMAALENGAETSLQEAKAREEAFEQGIKAARLKGLKERDSFLQEAGEEEKRIVGEINAKAQAELVSVREQIAKEAASVRAVLQEEVDGFAKAIGQKILGRAI
jgi:F-type H+-transporting ATPase subunit b